MKVILISASKKASISQNVTIALSVDFILHKDNYLQQKVK